MIKRPLMFLFLSSIVIVGQSAYAQSTNCAKWRSQVDESMERQGILTPDKLTVEQKIEGIECLLTLDGENGKGRFKGSTKIVWEKSIPTPLPKAAPPVSIVALYYASYLFTGDWGHGGQVVLYDRRTNRQIETTEIPNAYKAYRSWWAKVKAIGFQNAQTSDLDPLKDTDFRW